MNLVIVAIADVNTDKERIELRALADDNVINYILLDARQGDTLTTSNKCRNAFWFPAQSVKKGDLIRIFTKPGKTSSIVIGTYKRYTFYWGVKGSLWKDNTHNVHLLRIIEFTSRNML